MLALATASSSSSGGGWGFPILSGSWRSCTLEIPSVVGGSGRVLTVSLVAVSDVVVKGQFYLEVWTDPSSGHPKNSRTHSGSRRHPVDLGGERLELDWTGSERQLVIQLLELSGSKQNRDLPVAELRVPRSAIERYAREAAAGGEDLRFGARNFRMSPLSRQEALQRRRRFHDMLLPAGIATAIFSKIGEEQGVHIPTQGEIDKLRDENMHLRMENSVLVSKQGLPGGAPLATAAAAAAAGLHMPTLSLRFELGQRRKGFDMGLPRMASFQDLASHS